MRTINQSIFTYSELSEGAQEKARGLFKDGHQYSWVDEGIDSVKAFCKHYGVTMKDYSLSPYAHSYIETNADNQSFRGLSLKQLEKDQDLMPTGYCIDSDLFITMYESTYVNGGNALEGFKQAIDAV